MYGRRIIMQELIAAIQARNVRISQYRGLFLDIYV